MQLLLKKGTDADVNAQRVLYSNALQVDLSRDRDQVVQLLLEAGADVDTQAEDHSRASEAVMTLKPHADLLDSKREGCPSQRTGSAKRQRVTSGGPSTAESLLRANSEREFFIHGL